MADHAKPTLTSLYPEVLAEIDARFQDLAKALDPATTTPTNLTAGAVRWNSSNGYYEKYNGSAWERLQSAAAARTVLGLNNVENTADADKPISTATAIALGAKASSVAVNEALGLKADDSGVVHKTSAETIAGTKTFSSPPKVPAPVEDEDAVNKVYVTTALEGVGVPAKGMQVFTASGTFTVPDGVTSVKVRLCGGGGGGSCQHSGYGTNGGTSSFGTFISATGGGAGSSGATSGASGVGIGGTINRSGVEVGAQRYYFGAVVGGGVTSEFGELTRGSGASSGILGGFGGGHPSSIRHATGYGNGGGGFSAITSATAGGGGAGGYAEGFFDVSHLSTIPVTVGAKGVGIYYNSSYFGGDGSDGVVIVEW